MHAFTPGTRVRTQYRRSTGYIVRHHQTLPAWIVRFDGIAYDLAYSDDMLRRAAR